MSKLIDLTNQRFGRLVVIERAENTKSGKARWLCQCDCGKQKVVYSSALRAGLTVSCGCKKLEEMKKYNESQVVNEVGNVYGYLTVISRNYDKDKQKDGRAMWNCKCKCGNDYVVSGKLLREGKVTSCGCRVQSLGEEKIETLLLKEQINYSKEFLVDVRKEKIYQHHKARFDFAILEGANVKYFIEYDGEQHFNWKKGYTSTWNNEENFYKTQERDELKNEWCRDNKIPLIRIPYWHYNDLCIEDLLLETSSFIV